MATIAILHGSARSVRPLRKRSDHGPGEVFGYEVSVITEAGPVLGDTQKVTVFLSDYEAITPALRPGSPVTWAVEFSANKYGLQAVYRQDVAVRQPEYEPEAA